jgi:hypothetical protein
VVVLWVPVAMTVSSRSSVWSAPLTVPALKLEPSAPLDGDVDPRPFDVDGTAWRGGRADVVIGLQLEQPGFVEEGADAGER